MYADAEIILCGAVPNHISIMAVRLERETDDLERHVSRLENTVKAVARESGSVTVHGPCQHCNDCLLFYRDGTLYCPHCGDGRHL